MNFDLDQLRIFEEIMRSRSFTIAGETLGMAQSSVSQQLERLERQVGRKLVSRTTRRVAPTPSGDAFRIYAHAMLAIADDTRRFFERHTMTNRIRLGVVEDFAFSELHLLLALFKEQHPSFLLSLVTGMSAGLLRRLEAGDLDIVLGKRLPGRANGRLLYSEPLVWCGNREKFQGEISDVIPVVTHPAPSETRDIIFQAMKRGDRLFEIVVESEGWAGIQAAIASGIGIAAFSRRFIPHGAETLNDSHNLPTLGQVEYIVDQKAHPRDDAVDAFVELLMQTAATSVRLD